MSRAQRWRRNGADLGIFGGELKREHLGPMHVHLGAFDWVVIDEHEAIESQIQLAGELGNILGFRLPIDALGDNMLTFQGHFVATRVKYGMNIGFNVLAEETEQKARLL